jgi:chromosome segregation ATPase
MANQANITSLDALESFRASLIVFLTKARRSLDEASEEVKRTRQWLQHEQKAHWEGEFRRRTKQLEQAQQELMSARLATHQESAMLARQMAVSKAKRDLAEVEQKLRKLKAWTMSFDTAADPIVKQMDRLRQTLNDLAHAVTYLASVHKTLEAYAESAPAATLPASAPASSPEAGDAATTTEPA